MLAGPISLKKYWRRFFLYRPQDTTISLPQFAFFSVCFVRGVFAWSGWQREGSDGWIVARIKVSSRWPLSRRGGRTAVNLSSTSEIHWSHDRMWNPPFVSRTLACRARSAGRVNNVEGLVGNVRQQINQPHPGCYCPVWILAVIFVMAEALFVDVLRGDRRQKRCGSLLFFSPVLSITLNGRSALHVYSWWKWIDTRNRNWSISTTVVKSPKGANEECIKRL